MPRPVSSVLISLMLLAGGADALAAPIQNPDMAVLPDPDLSKAARLPARAATQGQAWISPALDSVNIRTRDCSALKPCAVAEPEQAAVAQPPAQHIGERRRLRRPG